MTLFSSKILLVNRKHYADYINKFQVTKNVYPVEENMLDVWCDVRASDFAWNVVILFEIEVKVVVVVLTKIYSIKMVTSYEIAVKPVFQIETKKFFVCLITCGICCCRSCSIRCCCRRRRWCLKVVIGIFIMKLLL